MVNERRDTGEVFVEYTKSICPVCKVVIDAEVNIRDDKVYLRKNCRDHGRFEALVYGDAQMYLDYTRFNKPGTLPRCSFRPRSSTAAHLIADCVRSTSNTPVSASSR
ncbi:MAG: hypothetical protein U5N53_20485 [Mycobacterium sp.]|nr:hypothetical protein [Mycobacterium sp.]